MPRHRVSMQVSRTTSGPRARFTRTNILSRWKEEEEEEEPSSPLLRRPLPPIVVPPILFLDPRVYSWISFSFFLFSFSSLSLSFSILFQNLRSYLTGSIECKRKKKTKETNRFDFRGNSFFYFGNFKIALFLLFSSSSFLNLFVPKLFRWVFFFFFTKCGEKICMYFQRMSLFYRWIGPRSKNLRVHHENAINLQCEQVRRVPRNKHGMLGREERARFTRASWERILG